MHLTGEDPHCLEFIYFSAGGNKEKGTETDRSERIYENVNPPIKKGKTSVNCLLKIYTSGLNL